MTKKILSLSIILILAISYFVIRQDFEKTLDTNTAIAQAFRAVQEISGGV